MKTTSTPSVKFPGWIGHTDIYTRADGSEVRRSYWMTHERYRFAIGIYRSANGSFSAELLTKQQGSWEPARNEFSGTVAEVVAEAERRGAYWEAQHGPHHCMCCGREASKGQHGKGVCAVGPGAFGQWNSVALAEFITSDAAEDLKDRAKKVLDNRKRVNETDYKAWA